MTDVRNLKDASGNVFYPETHAQAVVGLSEEITDGQAVKSVNGKTGTVQLTAADIGAATPGDIPDVPVVSVAGKTGAVILEKADIGLDQVDNTADMDKPVSTAQQTELNKKQDKILVSPGGSKFLISVADDGTLSTIPYTEGE